MTKSFVLVLIAVTIVVVPVPASGQNINYNESEISDYTLPDPLVFNNGRRVRTAKQWTWKRRAEVLEVFSSQMFGHVPSAPEGLHFELLTQESIYEGLGVRKTVRAWLDAQEEHAFDIMVQIPSHHNKPVPMMAFVNFYGNENTVDPTKTKQTSYEMILSAGFGMATVWRDEIEPDSAKPVDKGVRSWYNIGGDWGAISAWAWALSRVMDYLETDPDVDASRVAVLGHSRLGKTALWAGANDERFAIVISNCSGCCGAAISRRRIGENFEWIASHFPHWFCPAFQQYKGREDAFPADQHWLSALTAPRPLYIASGSEDLWADPRGEWLCAVNTAPVYSLFGLKGLSGAVMPEVNTPDMDGSIGYHVHKGKHGLTPYDWKNYLLFAARHFEMNIPEL